MASFDDIVNKCKKTWGDPDIMDRASARRGKKIPFSSPLCNYATYGGIPCYRMTEFFGEPGSGKAQPLYSKILTPSGFTTMGRVKVGDQVFDGDGNICKVTNVFPQGKRPIYEITTQGKNKIRVADNHLNSVWWYNETKHCREDFVWTTEELIDKFNQYGHWRRIRFDIPEVNWEYQPVPLDPYLVGALIGDGSLSNNFGFSNSEEDVIYKINELIHDYDYELVQYVSSNYDWSMRVIPDKYVSGKKTYFRQKIAELGLDCRCVDKRIPDIYLYNDRSVRLSLLQGLFDTDGCINKSGDVEISTSSPQLSENLSFLVRSLGIRDTVTPRQGKYKDDNGDHICNISYQHRLKIPNGLKFYTSKKHSARYKNRQHPPMRNITSIEYIGLEECQCIMVDSPKHTYISDDFLPTHNTTSAVDICKNAVDMFHKEYDDKVSELEHKIASGNKTLQTELADLQDRGPKRVLYVDLEHGFDAEWAKTLGLSDEINVMQPPDQPAEAILQAVQEFVESGQVGLIVLDSIPSLVPQAELDKKYGERTVASLAGLLTIFCRKIVSLLTRYECTLLVINQVRDNMDNPYVVKTPGGEALKFYSSLRMYFRIGQPVDFLGNEIPVSSENPAGYIVNAKLMKQKTAKFDRKLASYFLMCNSGIRPDFDYAKLAITKYGIIRKSGAWYTMCMPDTGEVIEEDGKILKVNGLAKVYDYLQQNSEYYTKLKNFIEADINGSSQDESLTEEAF